MNITNKIKNNQKFKNKYCISSTRLKYYNYAQNGSYFVTICTKNRECFFGHVDKAKMDLSEMGKIVKKYWLKIPKHFLNVKLGKFVIMPNHMHGIVIIDNNNADTLQPVETLQCNVSTTTTTITTNNINYYSKISPNPKSLSTIIRSYKSVCTKIINKIQNKIFFAWQPRLF